MFDTVEGYASQNDFITYSMMVDMFTFKAGVAEIGTYFGRNFCMLNYFSNKKPSFAIDIYDRQELNWPASGEGALTRAGFEEVLQKQDTFKGKNVTIIEGDSLHLQDDIVKTIGDNKVKMFCIDGAHTRHHVLADLHTAELCIHDAGVVILDDFFSFQYPSVTEALLRYEGNLKPFLFCDNKLYLCKPDYQYQYYQHMRNKTFTVDGQHTEWFDKFDERVNIVTFSRLLDSEIICYKYRP